MSVEKSERTLVKSMGSITYQAAYALQEHYHRQVVDEIIPACLLILEHPSVLTLGKNADEALILMEHSERERLGIECVRTDRGGEVTAHMPGQLVVYPILPLQRLRLQPRVYINKLMRAAIETLAAFGIKGRCDPIYPGVWVGDKKICAVGVRIRERVSLHGMALNVNNSLELFKHIVPCGIRHLGVTSMARELSHIVDMNDLQTVLLRQLGRELEIELDVQGLTAPLESTLPQGWI